MGFEGRRYMDCTEGTIQGKGTMNVQVQCQQQGMGLGRSSHAYQGGTYLQVVMVKLKLQMRSDQQKMEEGSSNSLLSCMEQDGR